MKLQGILGKGTGKLGNAVFAVSGGEQIMREYNPNVSNPNTEAQVAQRAKLKLMSQLAASLSSVIAIPKQGLVSSRNLFIKENIGQTYFEEGIAKINFADLQLTKGIVMLPVLNATKVDGSLTVKLDSSAAASISRIVYILCDAEEEGLINVRDSKVANVPGANRDFEATFESVGDQEKVLYAYGMIDKDGAATAKYNEYYVTGADVLAQLVTSRALGVGNYAFTKTIGRYMQS